ncbi:MAG: hypothetical protein K2O30_08585 [Duncaniella sp.]|nr:hypothetical protein [Duncaniella sp.]MDE7146184.1 hypothetical protein [Duncaniella sp.]
MNQHFNTHTEGIDLKFWHDLIEDHGKLITLSRGDLLCELGEFSSVFGFVVSGYFRYDGFENKNRDALIGGFAFPGALVGNYPDCMENAPSPFCIRAGRKSTAMVMDATILPDIYDKDSKACRQGRIMIQQAYKSLRVRYIDLYSKSPTERYLDLIHCHSQIEQDVPQKEIAAYLQITPTHLSRIRKELLTLE